MYTYTYTYIPRYMLFTFSRVCCGCSAESSSIVTVRTSASARIPSGRCTATCASIGPLLTQSRRRPSEAWNTLQDVTVT